MVHVTVDAVLSAVSRSKDQRSKVTLMRWRSTWLIHRLLYNSI